MKRVVLVLLLLFGTVSLAHAGNPKISPELQAYKPGQQIQVIVQYAPGTQVSCTGLLGLVDCLLNDVTKLGGTVLGQLPLVNGVVALFSSHLMSSVSVGP